MLWQIVEIKGGEKTVKMIDVLKICNNRIDELRSSYRGGKVKFLLEKAPEGAEKFEKKPIPGGWRSGSYSPHPRIVKGK